MTTTRPLSLRRALTAAGAAALLMLAPSALAQERGGAAPAAQRLAGKPLARAGLTRVSDLFWLLNGWETTSLDGYAPRPSAVGMPGTPLVMADGQPFDVGPLGQPTLATLPVHLQQARAAEASRAPQLVAGRLAPDGALRLRLRPPPPGLAAEGAFSLGNEVGDPGPFRTTERRVLNVDRIGPQYFAEASLRGPQGASAELSLQALRHYTTDRPIRARTENVQDTLDGPPLQQLIAPRVSLRDGALLPGTHRLTVDYATLRALPLFETLGYEVPARRRRASASVRGRLPPDRVLPLNYRLSYRHATLRSAPTRFGARAAPFPSFDWAEDRLSAQLGTGRLSLRSGPGDVPVEVRAGLSGDYVHGQARGASLDDPDVLTARAYTAFSVPGPGLRPRLALLVSQTNGQFGGGTLFSARYAPEERAQAGLQLGYVRRPYAAEGRQWYWLAQGLPVPQAPEARVTLPASFAASERFTADVRLSRSFTGGLRLTLEGGARHFQSMTLPDARYGFAPVRSPVYPPPGGRLVPDLHLHTGAAGQTFYAAAEGASTFPEGLAHQLRYRIFAHRAANSEDGNQRAFDQRFRRVPRHWGRYTARLAVGDRFSVEARLTARSAERWPAYRRAAEAGGNAYRHRLPARLRVDLTATKRLWRDHLRARLALRNLLDAPLRSHPAGPVRRLAIFLSLEAQF
jgi:hypothetical protein